MRKSLVVLLVVLIAGISVLGQTRFSATGDLSGTAILWFVGTSVTAQFHGDLTLSGNLSIRDETISFTTHGKINGSGKGDTVALSFVAWATFVTHGALENEEAIEIRGGLSVGSEDTTLSSDTAGAGAGSFYLVILLGEARIKVKGTVNGSVGGRFVPPDDPYTMQFDGSGKLQFEAAAETPSEKSASTDTQTIQEQLPWDLATWPEELSSYLLSLLEEVSLE